MLDPGTAQRTAFHVRFAVQCTRPGAVARIRFASTSPAANPDGYLVTISSRSSRLALAHEQVSETAGSRLDLATFESAGDGDIHAYDLFIDPRPDDGGVTEVTVVRDREVLGVAVDPLPIGSSSGAIAIDADADCRVER